MLSLCFNHVATVASPFCSSVFHFLAKLSKIWEIFFSCEKKTMKLSLLHKNGNTSSHIKGSLMAPTTVYQFELWLKVRYMPSKLSLPRQGPWNWVWVKQVCELSEVELTEFHCILGAFVCSGFSRPKWISVAKSAKLRKSATEKRDPKKHLSLSVAVRDWSIRTEFPGRK